MAFSCSSVVLIVFSLFLLQCLRGNAAKCHADDEAGLLGFKSGITDDPSGMLNSWEAGTDCCTWGGIECQGGNRVTDIILFGGGDPKIYLTGTISPALSKVRYLQTIYFKDLQNITGTFPELVFKLPRLQFFYIENCDLHGRLPSKIGRLSRLQGPSFAKNAFSGPIPSSISKLTQLTYLSLGSNYFTGEIPDGIRHLKNLSVLNLEQNLFHGKIPDAFSSFFDLYFLSLSNNGLSGEIPPSISALAPRLAFLLLDRNNLSGNIPDFLGNFKALDTLNLSWNGFSGIVPKSFRNLTKIFNLDFSHNDLVDPFPAMDVRGIESLDLSYNHFHLGQIPKWVTSSPIIYSLKLARCGLKFKLDDWKPYETYFYDYIDLSDNEISGSPVRLLNSTDYLVGFWAARNQLRFNMENLKLPKMKTLKYLDLSRNLIYGKLPSSISGLKKLNVAYNHLCCKIPATRFSAKAFLGRLSV
ncbi:PREDICTED: MDIS1-interacting receptor like kinase 2-like [Nelumbo nucifera]|uniref:Leucine-rich repeat-containing N-terminal plant-type domain-containing protein n=2 Tax=Nelumbo nucifera TaxID=4432 RepID=A0A822ZTB2_NELNU|nr:PREDICTED: MDIS1-interacting receptor like kinase 2-like [Nelumbo nucifera]DAD48117.1 TPA_asm: hypothetical protein HUJ06_018054 [Nelumbo nucifera]